MVSPVSWPDHHKKDSAISKEVLQINTNTQPGFPDHKESMEVPGKKTTVWIESGPLE